MLTRHSSIFQIMSWNWKHLIKRKVFWHLILHSYLCNALYKFLITIEKSLCFSKAYSEIESTRSINWDMEFYDSCKQKWFCQVNYLYNVNRKHVEARNQWTNTSAAFTVLWCSIKKLLLKILQYPQETPVLESLFKKLAGL